MHCHMNIRVRKTYLWLCLDIKLLVTEHSDLRLLDFWTAITSIHKTFWFITTRKHAALHNKSLSNIWIAQAAKKPVSEEYCLLECDTM